MSYAQQAKDFDENVLANSTDSPGLSTGFSENFVTGVGQLVDNFLSISEWFVRDSGGWSLSDRNDELKKLRSTGGLTDDEYSSFIKEDNRGMLYPDYSAMAEYANNKLGTSIRTDKEINEQMREGLSKRRARAQDVADRQTTTGFIGNVAGTMVGFALEPAGIAAIPLEGVMLGRAAYSLSQATTRLARAAQVAKISAVANMATETAIQPILFNWHEKIGVDMTWKDALLNVGSVGVLSGAITGGVSGFKSKARFQREQLAGQLKEKLKNGEALTAKEQTIIDDETTVLRETGDETTIADVRETLATVRRDSENIVDDTETMAYIKQIEDELDTVPNGSAREHFEKMDATEKAFNEYTNKTMKSDDIDSVIDEQQLNDSFDQAMLDEDGFMNDFNDMDLFDDPYADIYDAQRFDKLSKKEKKAEIEKGIKSFNKVQGMEERQKVIDLCLLGGAL